MPVMINIQTLGLDKKSAIAAIAAVEFTFGKHDAFGGMFYKRLAWRKQNREVDPETICWWRAKRVAMETLVGKNRLSYALEDLDTFLLGHHQIWCKAPDFTIGVLTDAYRAHNVGRLPCWYTTRCVYDTQTIIKDYELAKGGMHFRMPRPSNIAIDDAKQDANYIIKAAEFVGKDYSKSINYEGM